MVNRVDRGRLYSCPFRSADFTESDKDEIVVVLVAKYGDDKRCLVARVESRDSAFEPRLDQIYAVPITKLSDLKGKTKATVGDLAGLKRELCQLIKNGK